MRLCSWIADSRAVPERDCAAQLATESAANDFEASPRGRRGTVTQHQARLEGLRRRSNRHALWNTKGRNVRSKIR